MHNQWLRHHYFLAQGQRKIKCKQDNCSRISCVGCTRAVSGRLGRMCMVCVASTGMDMCNQVTDMCSKPKIPALEIVEKALQVRFGKWTFELNREQVNQIYVKHGLLRRVQEIVGGSAGVADLMTIKNTVISEFGKAAWEANRKQVLVAQTCTHETALCTLIGFTASCKHPVDSLLNIPRLAFTGP